MSLSFLIFTKGKMDEAVVKMMLKHYQDGLLSSEEFIAFIEGLCDNEGRPLESDIRRDLDL